MIESRAVTIQVGSSSYHSINDLGLYIGNYDCVGEPKVDTHFVTIPGRDGYIDLSEAIAGRPIYTERDIEIQFGSLKTPSTWPAQISQIYNYFHGRTIRLIFDDDTDWYYEGRAAIEGFAFFRQVGVFTLKVKAKPFKYGVTAQELNWTLTTSYVSKDAPASAMPVCPEFTVAGISDSYSVDVRIASGYPGYGWSKSLGSNGTYRFPELLITSATRFQARKLSTSGATLKITYRQASL